MALIESKVGNADLTKEQIEEYRAVSSRPPSYIACFLRIPRSPDTPHCVDTAMARADYRLAFSFADELLVGFCASGFVATEQGQQRLGI